MRLAIAAFVAFAIVRDASAAGVRLEMREGKVWLSADDAPVAQILSEWARIGHTEILNAERLRSTPVSLELNGVPEEQALEIVLRAASGYVAVNRSASDPVPTGTVSRFERIVIVGAPSAADAAARSVVASAAPALPPSAPPAAAPPPIFDASGAQRVIGPDGQPVPDDQDDAPPSPPTGSIPPGFSPQPEPPPQITTPDLPRAVPTTPGGVPRPGQIVAPPPPRRPGG